MGVLCLDVKMCAIPDWRVPGDMLEHILSRTRPCFQLNHLLGNDSDLCFRCIGDFEALLAGL